MEAYTFFYANEPPSPKSYEKARKAKNSKDLLVSILFLLYGGRLFEGGCYLKKCLREACPARSYEGALFPGKALIRGNTELLVSYFHKSKFSKLFIFI